MGAAGPLSNLRIGGGCEEGRGKPEVRLSVGNEERSRRDVLPLVLGRFGGLMKLNQAQSEQIDEAFLGQSINPALGNDESGRTDGGAREILVDLKERTQPRGAMIGGVLDAEKGAGLGVGHDVLQGPASARPRMGVIGALFALSTAQGRHALYGVGDVHARDFCQHAHTTVSVLEGSRGTPRIEHAVADDPSEPLLAHAFHDRSSQVVQLGLEQGVHEGLIGIHERRHEHARSPCSHLVLIHHNLGPVACVKCCRCDAGFRLSQHEPVAVVVVSHVLVVQHRKPEAAPFRVVFEATPPRDGGLVAVRIMARSEDDDGVVQYLQPRGIFGTRQEMDRRNGGLCGPHFVGVNGGIHEHDRLAGCDVLVEGRPIHATRICKGEILSNECFTPPKIAWVADDHAQHVAALGRFSDDFGDHAIGGRGHLLHGVDDLGIASEASVLARLEAEKLLRRGNLGPNDLGEGHEDNGEET